MQETNPPSGLRAVIAETIRVELARRRMSQRALADATGLSQSYIGRRMTSEMPFTTDDLELVAQALRVSVLTLLTPHPSALAAVEPAA